MLEMAGATIRKHLVGRKEPKQNAQLRSEATPEQEGVQKDEGLSLGVVFGGERIRVPYSCDCLWLFVRWPLEVLGRGQPHGRHAPRALSPFPCLADLQGCLSGLLPKSAEP